MSPWKIWVKCIVTEPHQTIANHAPYALHSLWVTTGSCNGLVASHYLSQYWPRCMSSYGLTRPKSKYVMHAPPPPPPMQTYDLVVVNYLYWTCVIHSSMFMSNWISQSVELLHFCLCYCSLWHHNAATIASVTSQWGTHWGVLSNQKAPVLVPPSSNNPHDINWKNMEFLMDVIIIFTHQNRA